MKNELYHHGILGMKWGDRNGPPYPLNASDKSSAERNAGHNISARDVKKNMDYMDDKELQKAINRINMQNQVSNLAYQENSIVKGRTAVNREMNSFNSTVNTGLATVAIVKKIAKLVTTL